MDQYRKEDLEASLEDISLLIKRTDRWVYERGPKNQHLTNHHTRNLWVRIKPILSSMEDALVILSEELKNE